LATRAEKPLRSAYIVGLHCLRTSRIIKSEIWPSDVSGVFISLTGGGVMERVYHSAFLIEISILNYLNQYVIFTGTSRKGLEKC
jgi:hypothetical protein